MIQSVHCKAILVVVRISNHYLGQPGFALGQVDTILLSVQDQGAIVVSI